jgi:hypothetical protein
MKFPYSGFLSPAPDTGEQVIIFRPEVPLQMFGPAGSVTSLAIVDTGADNTILPLAIAQKLQIKREECKGPSASAFGGQQIAMKYADIQLGLDDGQLQLKWHARVYFAALQHPGPETILVGHQGFLDYFKATFDGENLELVLQPTEDLPAV